MPDYVTRPDLLNAVKTLQTSIERGQRKDPFQRYATLPDLYVLSREDGLLYLQGDTVTLDAMNVSSSTRYQLRNLPSSVQPANMYYDPGTSAMAYSTSSKRFKVDIDSLEADVAKYLKLEPKRFKSKAEVAEQGALAGTHVGFIAEEADELGLEDWVTYDEEGPLAFDYSGWVIALQAIVRSQAEQIASLEQRVSRLEGGGDD